MSEDEQKIKEAVMEIEGRVRKIIDDGFRTYTMYMRQLLDFQKEITPLTEEVAHAFKYRLVNVVSIDDLRLVGTCTNLLAKQLNRLMEFNNTFLKDLKELTIVLVTLSFYASLYTTHKYVTEYDKQTLARMFNVIDDKIKNVEKELMGLKVRLKGTSRIPKEAIDALKVLQKSIQETKERQKNYVR